MSIWVKFYPIVLTFIRVTSEVSVLLLLLVNFQIIPDTYKILYIYLYILIMKKKPTGT